MTEKYFIIGDIHGCFEEFLELIDGIEPDREIVSVGDLIDRGPAPEKVLQYFVDHDLKFVIGNHEDKLIRYLAGNPVKVSKALAETIRQIEAHPYRDDLVESLMTMAHDYCLSLDDDKLVVVHAAYIVSKETISLEGRSKYSSEVKVT